MLSRISNALWLALALWAPLCCAGHRGKPPLSQAQKLYAKATSEARTQRFGAALQSFLQVQELARSNDPQLAGKAQFQAARIVQESQKDTAKALSLYRALIHDCPNCAAARSALLHIEAIEADAISSSTLRAQSLAEELRQILARHPRSDIAPYALFRLGKLQLEQLEDFTQALHTFDDLAAHYGRAHFDEGTYYAALSLLALGRPEEAMRRLDQLIATFEKWTALFDHNSQYIDDARLLKALIALYHPGSSAEAERTLEQLVKNHPLSRLLDEALYALTVLAHARGDFVRAKGYYHQLMRLRPESKWLSPAEALFLSPH